MFYAEKDYCVSYLKKLRLKEISQGNKAMDTYKSPFHFGMKHIYEPICLFRCFFRSIINVTVYKVFLVVADGVNNLETSQTGL